MSRDKSLVVTHVHANNINIGDEAINYSLYRLLDEYNPAFMDVTNYTDGYQGIIAKCNDCSLLKCFGMIRQSDLVVFGPGDVITDWSFTYKCMAMAVLLGKPFACIGVGVNFTKVAQFKRLILKQILKCCQLFIMRDKKSYDLLGAFGIPRERLKLSSDIFFTNVQGHTFESVTPESPYIVLSLRSMEFNSKTWSDACYEEIARSINYLVDKYGFDVKLLPMLSAKRNSVRPNMLPADDQFLLEIRRRAKDKERFILMTDVDSYQQAMEIIGNAKFVIATRLHTMIMATCGSVPFIGLSYSIKTDSYCIDNGLQDFIVDIECFKQEQINSIADKIMNDYENTKQKFWKVYRKNQDLSSVYAEELRSLLSFRVAYAEPINRV